MWILNGILLLATALLIQLPDAHAQTNACTAAAVATCGPYTCVQTDTFFSCLCPNLQLASSAAACGVIVPVTTTQSPIIINQCGTAFCPTGATCVPTNQNPSLYVCVCPNGLIANPDCSSTLPTNNLCLTSNPCTNGGTCIINSLTLQPVCICPPNTYGSNCASICRTTCDQSWCYNGGRCSNTYGQAYCSCPQSFRGRRCELRLNPYNYVYLYQNPTYIYGK